MTMIVPRRMDQAALGLARGQAGTAVGLLLATDFGNATFNGGVLAAAGTAMSGLINVAGYNSFEVIITMSGGTSVVVKIGTPDYNDLVTPYSPLFLDVMGTITPTSGRALAGATTGIRPTDSWAWIYIQLTGSNPLGATDVFATLICSSR